MISYDPERAGALCSVCPLRGSVVVPPEGPSDAELVIIGEGPGQNEVHQRKPFVGASGVKLNGLLGASGLLRSRVFVTNAMLCRCEVPDEEGRKRYEVKRYLAWVRRENAAYRKAWRAAVVAAKRAGQPIPPEPTPTPTPLECCRPRLLRELDWFERVAAEKRQPNGAVVMPLGNYAALALTGKSAGIQKLRGHPTPVDLAQLFGAH